jgi:hypothetical protein
MQFDAARAMRYNPVTNLEFVRIVENPPMRKPSS